jgi:hypothetical protein
MNVVRGIVEKFGVFGTKCNGCILKVTIFEIFMQYTQDQVNY